MITGCRVFFFQAEDGIRDAQEARGLGDVYKRQGEGLAENPALEMTRVWLPLASMIPSDVEQELRAIFGDAYRGLDEATDVLSFENDFIDLETGARFIGDIVISIEKAQAQAAESGFSLKEELEMLLVHAVLHLNGYDHIEEADLEEIGSLQEESLIAIANPVLGSISRE